MQLNFVTFNLSSKGSTWQEYRVIADYKGETADQLSVKSGETILVISKKEGGWSDKRISILYDRNFAFVCIIQEHMIVYRFMHTL